MEKAWLELVRRKMRTMRTSLLRFRSRCSSSTASLHASSSSETSTTSSSSSGCRRKQCTIENWPTRYHTSFWPRSIASRICRSTLKISWAQNWRKKRNNFTFRSSRLKRKSRLRKSKPVKEKSPRKNCKRNTVSSFGARARSLNSRYVLSSTDSNMAMTMLSSSALARRVRKLRTQSVK